MKIIVTIRDFRYKNDKLLKIFITNTNRNIRDLMNRGCVGNFYIFYNRVRVFINQEWFDVHEPYSIHLSSNLQIIINNNSFNEFLEKFSLKNRLPYLRDEVTVDKIISDFKGIDISSENTIDIISNQQNKDLGLYLSMMMEKF